jgi:hypothetical protein
MMIGTLMIQASDIIQASTLPPLAKISGRTQPVCALIGRTQLAAMVIITALNAMRHRRTTPIRHVLASLWSSSPDPAMA